MCRGITVGSPNRPPHQHRHHRAQQSTAPGSSRAQQRQDAECVNGGWAPRKLLVFGTLKLLCGARFTTVWRNAVCCLHAGCWAHVAISVLQPSREELHERLLHFLCTEQ